MSKTGNVEAMVDRVMHWSNINSGTFNTLGLKRMMVELQNSFSILQCTGEIIDTAPIEQIDEQGHIQTFELSPILHFYKRPEAPIKVLLVGHMDTVFEENHAFQKPCRQNENILVGPGVADMKGGLCVMLEALKAFELTENKHNLGWEVIINGDEEIGSLASSVFLEQRAQYNQVGLVFEPAMDAQGTLAGERKGSGKFTILVKGKAAHAGRDFHLGHNAIVLLSKLVAQLDSFNNQKEGLTINIGQIRGGGAVNIVPDFAMCRIDIRVANSEDAIWVQDKMETCINQANLIPGFLVELKGAFIRPPKKLIDRTKTLYDLVLNIAAQLKQPLSIRPSGGCSDGNNLSKVGLPNVDSLGVCGGHIHSSEEYILINSLIERTQLTTEILKILSIQGFSK